MNLDQDFTNYDGYDSAGEWIDSDEERDYDQQPPGGEPARAGTDRESDDEEDEVTPSKRELLGDVEAEWIKSGRNKEKLIFRGALYTINGASRSGEYLFARCERRDGCTSRLWLTAEGKLLYLHTGKHNHEPKPWRPENAKLNDQQMNLIETNTDLMPVQVIEQTTEALSPTRRTYLPRKDNMARKVSNKKRSILGLPAAFSTSSRRLEVFPELRPTRFKSDYERPVITAVRKAYPGIKCEGDSFHLFQAVMRKLQKLGLRNRYDSDYRFLHQVRLLFTPMFVPLRHVFDYWNDVVKTLITFPELRPLIDYMEYTWLGTRSAGGRRGRKPQFTSELWNQHECVVDERPRHNNHMESNNRKLQRLIKANPSVWDFMEGLRSAYKGDYNLLYQEWVNGVPTQRRTADIAKDRSIYNQVSRWKDVEGARPRLQPSEWARGMVRAMSL